MTSSMSQHNPNIPENRSPTFEEIQAADRATGGKVPVIELIKALIAATQEVPMVERYEPELAGPREDYADMVVVDGGDYVLHSDYEALEARCRELEEALQKEKSLSDRLASALEYIDDYCLSYPDLGTISAVAQPALKAHSDAASVRMQRDTAQAHAQKLTEALEKISNLETSLERSNDYNRGFIDGRWKSAKIAREALSLTPHVSPCRYS